MSTSSPQPERTWATDEQIRERLRVVLRWAEREALRAALAAGQDR